MVKLEKVSLTFHQAHLFYDKGLCPWCECSIRNFTGKLARWTRKQIKAAGINAKTGHAQSCSHKHLRVGLGPQGVKLYYVGSDPPQSHVDRFQADLVKIKRTNH